MGKLEKCIPKQYYTDETALCSLSNIQVLKSRGMYHENSQWSPYLQSFWNILCVNVQLKFGESE